MSQRGHKQPEFDNQSQLDIFSELPNSEVPETEQPAFHPPAGIQRIIDTEKAEAGKRYDVLDAQGMHTAPAIRQRIGRAALTAEDIERQEVEKIRQTAKLTRRPKKDRRHLGARQKNIADGDERVKTQYQLLGDEPRDID